jgi:hypothetical protein
VLAVRTLTALGVPIRCTYITFDPLMTMSELVQSYRFLGRRDILLTASVGRSLDDLLAMVQDDDNADAWSSREPFHSCVSYMLVSMECLLGSPYLRAVERAGLALDVVPLMGRRNALYRDPAIGYMSDWAQRWVDRNFAFDYTLKSLEKVSPPAQQHALRGLRRTLKASGYALLGRMLAWATGDPTLLPQECGPELGPVERRSAGLLHDRAACDAAMRELLDPHYQDLTKVISPHLRPLATSLGEHRGGVLLEQASRWMRKRDWSLINDAA